jgi:hypothetical protein
MIIRFLKAFLNSGIKSREITAARYIDRMKAENIIG